MPDKPVTSVAVYVVAHADDWQLFMMPNGYHDLVKADCKLILIVTTAGDAGMDAAYWCAREEGLKSSIRFCLAPRGDFTESSGVIEYNGHAISYWSVNSATCYFLRLPDGGLDGAGFAATDFASLTKFQSRQIQTLTAIDHSTTYRNTADLSITLQFIALSVTSRLSDIRIHYPNPDTTINPKDHADHLATGQVVQGMSISTRVQQVLYVGYSTSSSAAILLSADLFWKAALFAAYEKAVVDNCGYSTLREGVQTYVDWCSRSAQASTIAPDSEFS